VTRPPRRSRCGDVGWSRSVAGIGVVRLRWLAQAQIKPGAGEQVLAYRGSIFGRSLFDGDLDPERREEGRFMPTEHPRQIEILQARNEPGDPPASTPLICPHGGRVSATSSNARTKVDGDFILRPSDTFFHR
jgi:hypothetical protein